MTFGLQSNSASWLISGLDSLLLHGAVAARTKKKKRETVMEASLVPLDGSWLYLYIRKPLSSTAVKQTVQRGDALDNTPFMLGFEVFKL
jgi:hypothetical protein